MNQFTNDELNNILNIINIAPIKGSNAMTVALLQQKIVNLMKPDEKRPESEKKDATSTK
jgi:hypothetical protein